MFPAYLHTFVGRGHVDAAHLLHERGLVLQAPAEWQVKLTRLDIKAIRGAAIAYIRLLVLRAARRDLFVDIDSEAIRKNGQVGVNAELLESEGLRRRRIRLGISAPIRPQIAADAQPIGNLAGPGIERVVHSLCRQQYFCVRDSKVIT